MRIGIHARTGGSTARGRRVRRRGRRASACRCSRRARSGGRPRRSTRTSRPRFARARAASSASGRCSRTPRTSSTSARSTTRCCERSDRGARPTSWRGAMALGAAGVVTHIGTDADGRHAGGRASASPRRSRAACAAAGEGERPAAAARELGGCGRLVRRRASTSSARCSRRSTSAGSRAGCASTRVTRTRTGTTCRRPTAGRARSTSSRRAAVAERLRLLHANDCAFPLGSKRDRHAWIGDGAIGEQGFAAMVCEPRLAGRAGGHGDAGRGAGQGRREPQPAEDSTCRLRVTRRWRRSTDSSVATVASSSSVTSISRGDDLLAVVRDEEHVLELLRRELHRVVHVRAAEVRAVHAPGGARASHAGVSQSLPRRSAASARGSRTGRGAASTQPSSASMITLPERDGRLAHDRAGPRPRGRSP